MQYETVAQMAERLGVTVRTVQLWAKNDRLPGAIKQGRDYLIPAGLKKPDKLGYAQTTNRIPLPLINSEFLPGNCLEHISSFTDADDKTMAFAEYYYFTGQTQKAVETTEEFYNHPDISIRLSACFLYTFSHLAQGNTHMARIGIESITKSLNEEVNDNATPQFKAACMLLETTTSVLLHKKPPVNNFSEYIKYLPQGLRLWAFCILGHSAYHENDFNRAIGILETAIAIPAIDFPIPMIYLHVCAAANYMALKRIDDAKKHIFNAWELARKDHLIGAFAEYYGILYGLVEICLASEYADECEEIRLAAGRFSKSWKSIYKSNRKNEHFTGLTTTEFAISMLVARGWSNQEIADYMHFSINTIKRYISIVYQKFGITNRKELKLHLLN